MKQISFIFSPQANHREGEELQTVEQPSDDKLNPEHNQYQSYQPGESNVE